VDFSKYISTPVGRDASDSLTTRIKLTKGRLSGGFLFFPSGPAGKLHFLARMGIHQIIPFNTDEDLALDDCVIPFSLGIDLLEPPFEIECVTWNESESYDHALTVCFSLDPRGKKRHDLKALVDEFAQTNGYQKG